MSKELSNTKRNLIALRKRLVNSINRIDETLKELNKNRDKSQYCPKCFTRDLRMMKNNEMFCRSCGYDSREEKKNE